MDEMKLNLPQLVFVALIFGAAVIGAWFYWNQMAATPPWLWLFVPDCPLYAVLGAPILLFGRPKNAALRFVIASGLAVFGSWTIFVLMLHVDVYFHAVNLPLSLVLVAGHLGMILEGVLCLPKREELKFGMIFIAAGWFILNVQFDYLNGSINTHPWIPSSQLADVMLFTAFSSITWPVLLFAIAGMVEKEKAVSKIREKLLIVK